MIKCSCRTNLIFNLFSEPVFTILVKTLALFFVFTIRLYEKFVRRQTELCVFRGVGFVCATFLLEVIGNEKQVQYNHIKNLSIIKAGENYKI